MSVLKSNLERVKNVLAGKYTAKTKVSVGYTKESKRHKESGAVGKKRNPLWTSVTKTSTRELKRIHGACKGENPVVADELRCRGFNAKMLEELIWEWGQRQWEKAAKRASKIATTRNVEARRQKKRAKRRR